MGPLWRELLHFQSEWFIYSFSESPVKISHEIGGKHAVTVHGAPRGWKAYIQWGAGWFPKGII